MNILVSSVSKLVLKRFSSSNSTSLGHSASSLYGTVLSHNLLQNFLLLLDQVELVQIFPFLLTPYIGKVCFAYIGCLVCDNVTFSDFAEIICFSFSITILKPFALILYLFISSSFFLFVYFFYFPLSQSSRRLKTFVNLAISLSMHLFQNDYCWGLTDFLMSILSQTIVAPALISILKPYISFQVILEIALECIRRSQ